jgi:hypothetical protein
VHLRDLLKGFLPVDGHGGDHVFIEAERAHTIWLPSSPRTWTL